MAFGRLDTLRPGYEAAVAAARAHGFTPHVRAPGGHAAAYHRGSLVIEAHGEGDLTGITDRFRTEAIRLAEALRDLGVDARVGPVPREYCPGEWSVNLEGRVKLIGLAQRVRRDTYTVGAHVVCEDADPVRAVLTDVYAHLGIDMDPATIGVPGPPIDTIEAAVEWAYGLRSLVFGVDVDVPPTVVVAGRAWARRPEFHVTTFTPDALARATGLAVDELVAAAGRERAALEERRPVRFDGRVAHVRAPDGRESLVAFCDVPGLQAVYARMSRALGRALPRPPTHVTLYSATVDERGIGLATEAAVAERAVLLPADAARRVLSANAEEPHTQ